MFEITQKIAKQLNTTKGLDGNLYQTGQLIWALEGNVRKVNKINIEKLFSSSPQLLNLFPLLNEFENINNSNKLYTPGGELYYESGREYTGPYHMNDGLPMAGEIHTKEFHEILFFAKDLQTPNERKGLVDFNYEDFVKKQNRKKKRNWIKKSINALEGARNIFGNKPVLPNPSSFSKPPSDTPGTPPKYNPYFYGVTGAHSPGGRTNPGPSVKY